MPQLTIDIDEATLETGQVRATKRAANFVSRAFGLQHSITFNARWDPQRVLAAVSADGGIRFEREAIRFAKVNDRLRLFVNEVTEEATCRWFDGTAVLVHHIVERADTGFLRSFHGALPTRIDPEILSIEDARASRDVWPPLASALLDHMVGKQLFGVPPIRGLEMVLRRYDVELELGARVWSDHNNVVSADREAMLALQDLLSLAGATFDEPQWTSASLALEAGATEISEGRAISTDASSEDRNDRD